MHGFPLVAPPCRLTGIPRRGGVKFHWLGNLPLSEVLGLDCFGTCAERLAPNPIVKVIATMAVRIMMRNERLNQAMNTGFQQRAGYFYKMAESKPNDKV